MFGYILPDKPNMYMKDYYFYRSIYCGLCFLTKKIYGNVARIGVNYDLVFIDALLHGLRVREYESEEKVCIANPFKKKAVLKDNPISRKVTTLNVLLLEFKGKDDRRDGVDLKKKIAGAFFKRKAKKARKILPEIAVILDKAYIQQEEVEKIEGVSIDRAAHPFAVAIADCVCHLAEEDASQTLWKIVYDLGKYVYLMDAIDDFESDVKKKEFNPFKYENPECKTKADLIEKIGDDLWFLINATIKSIKENYENLPVFGTEGIITNTLWFGLRTGAEKIMNKETEKCQKTRF